MKIHDIRILTLLFHNRKLSKIWRNLWQKILYFPTENSICDGISNWKWLIGISFVEIDIITNPSQFLKDFATEWAVCRKKNWQNYGRPVTISTESFKLICMKSLPFLLKVFHVHIGHKRPYKVTILVTNCNGWKSVRIFSHTDCCIL